MTNRFNQLMVLGAIGLLAAGSASAQIKTWNFGDTTPNGACTGAYDTHGNAIGCTQQPSGTVVDLTARAFSSDASGSTFRTAAINQQGTGSGFGVYNQTEGTAAGSPDHAMDNNGTGVDMLLLNFTSAEILKTVTIGWSGADGDYQVLRYTGLSTDSFATVAATINTKTAGTMVGVSGGWELITTVDGAGGISSPDVATAVNSSNKSSSYWIISAFNSGFGSGGSSGIDAVKVLGVTTGTGSGSSVSAPGTLALAALSMLGLVAVRRRVGQ